VKKRPQKTPTKSGKEKYAREFDDMFERDGEDNKPKPGDSKPEPKDKSPEVVKKKPQTDPKKPGKEKYAREFDDMFERDFEEIEFDARDFDDQLYLD